MKLNKLRRKRHEFCIQLAQIKYRAGELGLYATMRKLDVAVYEVGYEVARLGKLADKGGG